MHGVELRFFGAPAARKEGCTGLAAAIVVLERWQQIRQRSSVNLGRIRAGMVSFSNSSLKTRSRRNRSQQQNAQYRSTCEALG